LFANHFHLEIALLARPFPHWPGGTQSRLPTGVVDAGEPLRMVFQGVELGS
jgi:hypothetical protein